jgi:hypothetical protein
MLESVQSEVNNERRQVHVHTQTVAPIVLLEYPASFLGISIRFSLEYARAQACS